MTNAEYLGKDGVWHGLNVDVHGFVIESGKDKFYPYEYWTLPDYFNARFAW